MPSGAELFARTLTHLGIDRIFTLVGDHLNEVLTVSARAGIQIIDMRHESGVTHAADAWARITRKPAISLVTGGPGHTNSLTGIATAQLAASPLIAISGSRATTVADRQAFQDIDQVGMARPVVKWAAEPPNSAQIPFYLGRAYAEANAGRRGAVHLTIPVDLFTGSTEAAAPMPQIRETYRPAPEQKSIDDAIRLLAAAERPVVIAGSGIWWSDAGAELTAFIEKAQLPLYTITMAKGVVSDEHPLCLGYADPALNVAMQKVLQEADLVLVLGKRIDYRLALGGARLFPPSTKFIQVDIHAQELGMNRALDVAICADVKLTLQALVNELPEKPADRSAWMQRLQELRSAWRGQLAERAAETSDLLHPAAFFTELGKWLPRETRFSWDGGDFIHWGRAILPALHPGGWLRLGPLGTIGSALPNSLSLKMAYPEHPVLMITGDGSLGFYIAELDTLVRYNLPVIVIVGNDGGWGLERELQAATTGPDIVACELRRTRYDIVTQGFGGGGETIDKLEEIGPAMQRALASRGPYCLNVNIRGVRSPFTDWQIKGKKK